MSVLPNGPELKMEDLHAIFLNNPFPFFRKCFNDYGDMFTLKMGDFGISRHGASGEWVFLANADDLKTLFKAKSTVILAGAASSILFQEIIPDEGSLMLDGPRHVERRAILSKLVQNQAKIRGFTDVILEITASEMAGFSGDQVFELTPVFRKISGRVMQAITFGDLEKESIETVRSNIEEFGRPGLSPDKKKGLISGCTHAIEKLMAECPHAAAAQNEGSVYSVLLNSCKLETAAPDGDVKALPLPTPDAKPKPEPKPLSVADVKAELLVVMLGGVDTTACAMGWIMAQIFYHPPVLEKVLAEINQVFGSGEMTPEKIEKLYYLQAVIYEACRISPALRNGATRLLIQPLTLREGTDKEITLPVGTIVTGCMHLVHMNSDYYPEPFEFKPERFFKVNPDPFKFIFFGGGIRKCLGTAFALYEMKTIIAALLHNYRFDPVNISIEPELQGSFFGPKGSIGVKLEQ